MRPSDDTRKQLRCRSVSPNTLFTVNYNNHADANCAQSSLPSLSLSYNGGKDCLVLLILYLSALYPTLKASNPPPSTISTIYIVPAHPFPEVDAFVDSSSKSYNLSCTRLEARDDSGDGMRDAFAVYLAERTEIKAIFVGTRRTDPHGGTLTGFDVTNGGWPRFMRVHPVLEWHYRDIWAVSLYSS